jgi:hypothetical protein
MKAKAKQKLTLLNRVTYPAGVLAAVAYLWCAGAFYSAIVASAVGVVGWAYGLASK